mgnify:CR=1 FL=1
MTTLIWPVSNIVSALLDLFALKTFIYIGCKYANMSRHKLIPYHLQLREKRQTVDYVDLLNILYTNVFEDQYADDLSSAPQTLIELFDEYCTTWRNRRGAYIDQDVQKTLRVSQEDGEYAIDRDNNIIEAIFKYGDYGQSVDSYNTETGDSDSNRLEPEEAAEIPLYLLLHVPESNPEEAIVVMEESSNRGMKLRFQGALQRELPSRVANEMSIIKDNNTYDTIRHADSIQRLKIETSESPDELGGEFSRAFSPSQSSKKVTYSSSNDGSLRLDVNGLESWIEENDNPLRNVNGNTYTEFKLTVKRAGSETTIDFLEDGVNLSRTLDDVEMEAGHPVPSYMGSQAREFVNQELLPQGASEIPRSSLLR